MADEPQTLLSRAEVAKALGVCVATVHRWEKTGKSPVQPRRLKRNKYLRYTQDDVERLQKWMNELDDGSYL